MEIVSQKIECNHSDLDAIVLPRLRGRIFHLTDPATFENIARNERICSYQQTGFTLAFGLSVNSYGRSRGWVSLFDLSKRADAEIKEALICHYFFRVFHSERPQICLFIAENAWPSLIHWQRAREEVGGKEMYIPFVEAWFPGDIPLDLVSDSLLLSIRSTS